MCIEYKMEITRNKILGIILLGAFVILLRFVPLEISNWFESTDENHTDEDAQTITPSKIVAMMLLGGVSILLGFIPFKLGKLFKDSHGNQKHDDVLSSLLCFGGGILLATSLLHMLPEVSFYIEKNFSQEHKTKLQLSI